DRVADEAVDVAEDELPEDEVAAEQVSDDNFVVQPEAYEEPMPAWLRSGSSTYAEPQPAAVDPEPLVLFEASRTSAPAPETPELAVETVEAPETAWGAGDIGSKAPLNPAPAGRERLELA